MRNARSIPRGVGVLLALGMSGCVSPAYRNTVGQFGAITSASVMAEDARLDALGAAETERIHAALAADRVDLRLSPDCAQRLALRQAGAGGGAAAPCHLVARGGASVDDTPRFAHIRALGAALADYADNLVALAADATADRAAFATSVSGLAASLGHLDGAVRDATGAPPAGSHAMLDAVATVAGKAGGLLLAAERARVLKRIVLNGDPIVQQAVAVLADVDDRLGLYDLSGLALKLQAAQDAASRLAATGAPPERLRPAQDALFAALDAYDGIGADQARYAAIGMAHAKLAAAARCGAGPAELHDAILAVLDLAAAVKAAAKTLPPAGAAVEGRP